LAEQHIVLAIVIIHVHGENFSLMFSALLQARRRRWQCFVICYLGLHYKYQYLTVLHYITLH